MPKLTEVSALKKSGVKRIAWRKLKLNLRLLARITIRNL
jgi:hypothetical protein